MSETAKWYIIHTYSGYENKVAQTIEKVVENRKIQDLIPEVCVPTEKAYEKKEDKIKEYDRKIFPAYVFVKMVLNDDTWYIVRNIRGVTGFVGPASKPVPVSDREMAEIFAKIGKKDTASIEVDFAIGDSVRVSDNGLVGVVKSINPDDQTVEVVLPIFGKETSATVEIMKVQKVDD